MVAGSIVLRNKVFSLEQLIGIREKREMCFSKEAGGLLFLFSVRLFRKFATKLKVGFSFKM